MIDCRLALNLKFKLITDEGSGCTGPRHRVQALVWMTQLAPRIEGNELQTSEVRLAIIRISQWGGEISRSNRNSSRGGAQVSFLDFNHKIDNSTSISH